MARPQPDRSLSEERQLGPEQMNPENPSMEEPQSPTPALGQRGRSVVQVNVETDMPTNGGAHPVNEGATEHYGLYRPRTIAMIVVAIVVALLLAFPVVWGLVELVVLAGVVGPIIWAWAALLVALIIGAVVIGFRIAQSGL